MGRTPNTTHTEICIDNAVSCLCKKPCTPSVVRLEFYIQESGRRVSGQGAVFGCRMSGQGVRTCPCSPPPDLMLTKVDTRLSGKANSNSHGARPVHQIITMTGLVRLEFYVSELGRQDMRVGAQGVRTCSASPPPYSMCRDWYLIAEQPAPAPLLAHPEGCALDVLSYALYNLPRP